MAMSWASRNARPVSPCPSLVASGYVWMSLSGKTVPSEAVSVAPGFAGPSRVGREPAACRDAAGGRRGEHRDAPSVGGLLQPQVAVGEPGAGAGAVGDLAGQRLVAAVLLPRDQDHGGVLGPFGVVPQEFGELGVRDRSAVDQHPSLLVAFEHGRVGGGPPGRGVQAPGVGGPAQVQAETGASGEVPAVRRAVGAGERGTLRVALSGQSVGGDGVQGDGTAPPVGAADEGEGVEVPGRVHRRVGRQVQQHAGDAVQVQGPPAEVGVCGARRLDDAQRGEEPVADVLRQVLGAEGGVDDGPQLPQAALYGVVGGRRRRCGVPAGVGRRGGGPRRRRVGLRYVGSGGAVPQGADGFVGGPVLGRCALGHGEQGAGAGQRLVLGVGGLDGVDVRGARVGRVAVEPAQQRVEGGLAGADPLGARVDAGRPV